MGLPFWNDSKFEEFYIHLHSLTDQCGKIISKYYINSAEQTELQMLKQIMLQPS